MEGLVIVVSILLAFGIEAWWDARQETNRRAELVEELTLDFEATRSRLSLLESRLARAAPARQRATVIGRRLVPSAITSSSISATSTGSGHLPRATTLPFTITV